MMEIEDHVVYVLLVTFLCQHTAPLFLCLHLLFSECLRMSGNVGLET